MANESAVNQASINKDREGHYVLQGSWLTRYLDGVSFVLERMDWPKQYPLTFDASRIESIDTNGALYLLDTIQSLRDRGHQIELSAVQPKVQHVIDLVSAYLPTEKQRTRPYRAWHIKHLDRLGRRVVDKLQHSVKILNFLGRIVTKIYHFFPVSARSMKQFGVHVEQFGVNALPIVGLLSFLIGVVLAYQMGIQLQQYGGNIFIVDFTSFAVLREFGPLIAAIIFAGRSGSAITAQLASMKLSEEIAALQVMGISPYERLVLPRLAAMMVCLPLVTVWANLAGLAGAMVMAHHMFDINFLTFIDRVSEATSLRTYFTGMIKTPVFALIIGIIGCYQGLNVEPRSDAVGKNTTLSVVQSIFLIIIADALFSILFSWRTI